MKNCFLLLLFTLTCYYAAHSQRNCASQEVLEEQIKVDPTRLQKMEEIERQIQEYARNNPDGGSRMVITIPVVFHVIWNTASQNISDAQVMSQLTTLNQDFRALNADISGLNGTVFSGLGADIEINFCLATQDPSGAATTGITRTFTNTTSFGTNDAMKFTASGGRDAWNTARYLNIWVCQLTGGLLGYAQFPGGPASTDGIVCLNTATGNTGTAAAPYNKGRTATHEIGHWLNLIHIWGDATCGNDLVGDTPVHNTANFGCPTYPHLSTCSGTPTEMTMNYMDYTDDPCMYMFSPGQKTRMRAIVDAGGPRALLATSTGCSGSNPPPPPSTCAAPSSVSTGTTTMTSIPVSWSAVTGATTYTVEYKISIESNWTIATTTAATTNYNIINLATNTLYNIRVKGNCTSSTYSNVVNAMTIIGNDPSNGSCTDVYEPNSPRLSAKPILLNVDVRAKISSPADKDFYKFNNTSAARNVNVTLNENPADYDLKLYRTSTLVDASENGGTTSESCTYNNNTTPATYYAEVYGYNGSYDPNNCYKLRATISSAPLRGDGSDILEEAVIDLTPIQDEFLIFPNPATSEVSIILPFKENKQGILQITDITGRIIHKEVITGSADQNVFNLDISKFETGMYITTFKIGADIYTQKLTKSPQ
jgi:hypothetical protein